MPTLRLLLIVWCCSAVAADLSTFAHDRFLSTKSERWARREEFRKKKAARMAEKLERLEKRPKNKCPAKKPRHGTRCRRHWLLEPCEYEFIKTPLLLDDGSCSKATGCVPYSQCLCSRKRIRANGNRRRRWKCIDNDFARCQAVDTYDSSQACVPKTGSSTPSPTPAPSANVFQREDVCPLTMPRPGTACKRSPALPPCGYEYINLPTYNDDGTCVAPLQCLPDTGCNCFGGEWECSTASRARCNGPPPRGSWDSCTPP